MSDPLRRLLADGPTVVAVGVEEFADSLRAQNAPVVRVAWRPPQRVDERVATLLEKLL